MIMLANKQDLPGLQNFFLKRMIYNMDLGALKLHEIKDIFNQVTESEMI